jgi:hypothetical protein
MITNCAQVFPDPGGQAPVDHCLEIKILKKI